MKIRQNRVRYQQFCLSEMVRDYIYLVNFECLFKSAHNECLNFDSWDRTSNAIYLTKQCFQYSIQPKTSIQILYCRHFLFRVLNNIWSYIIGKFWINILSIFRISYWFWSVIHNNGLCLTSWNIYHLTQFACNIWLNLWSSNKYKAHLVW